MTQKKNFRDKDDAGTEGRGMESERNKKYQLYDN